MLDALHLVIYVHPLPPLNQSSFLLDHATIGLGVVTSCQEHIAENRMTDSELLVGLQQKLLDAVASTDWEMYQELCDPSLTAFEPEAKGHLVEGLDFHKFYFDFLKQREGYSSPNNTMSNVKVCLAASALRKVAMQHSRSVKGSYTTHQLHQQMALPSCYCKQHNWHDLNSVAGTAAVCLP